MRKDADSHEKHKGKLRKRRRREENSSQREKSEGRRENCKLAGKEANYSTGLDWKVRHTRLKRWNEKETCFTRYFKAT